MTILDLPIDLIELICSYLTPEEIFQLSLTSKTINKLLNLQTIFKIMYLKKFNYSSNQLGSNWEIRFKTRVSKAKLFTWGSTDLGRLGYLIKEVPQDKLTRNRNVKYPNNLPNFNNLVITELKSNGFSFQILTNKGLFFTGNDYKRRIHSSPGPKLNDYQQSMALSGPIENVNTHSHAPVGVFPPPTPTPIHLGRLGGGPRILPINPMPTDRPTNPNLRLPPDQIPEITQFQPNQPQSKDDKEDKDGKSIESNFVTRLDTQGETIISISSGRMHFIGLSKTNKLLSWDTGNSSLKGIILKFPGLDTEATPILKIKCGWNLSSFYIKGKLIIWYSRTPVTENQVVNNDFSSECNYWIINDDKHEIIDWYLGPDFIILVKTLGVMGKVIDVGRYFHNLTGVEVLYDFQNLSSFNYWLKRENKNGLNKKFVKIVGCFSNFAIFTSNQEILIGNSSYIDKPDDLFGNDDEEGDEQEDEGRSLRVPEKIPLDDVVELEMGDYHFLALTSNGDCYSWGINSNNCGCLGIGDVNEVKQPMKVDGKWIVITAAGWHLGGIQSDLAR